MTDNIQHIDVDSDDYLDAPKALRDYVKKLQRQHQDVTKDLADVRGKLASQALGDVLSSKGFKNPKRVEKDLLAEGVDPLDKSAVDGWLAEFGDDYAQGEVKPAQETPVVPAEEQQAYQQLGLGAEFRSPADMTKLDAVRSELPEGASGADVVALLQKHGM